MNSAHDSLSSKKNPVIKTEEIVYDLLADNIIVSDYSNSLNKPAINSIELSGNKTASELGLVSVDDMAGMENT